MTAHRVLLALTVVASISVVGIVLVNALLVIPVATAKRLARSLGEMFVHTPVLGIGRVLAGLMVSSGSTRHVPPHGLRPEPRAGAQERGRRHGRGVQLQRPGLLPPRAGAVA